MHLKSLISHTVLSTRPRTPNKVRGIRVTIVCFLCSGLLYDLTGTFDASFYMAGAVGLLGGILILILIILMNFRDNTHEPVPKEDAEDSVRHPVSAIFASSEFGSQIIEQNV